LREPDGPALLAEFAEVALAGMRALNAEDRGDVGRLLDQNHQLLQKVGVSTDRIEALLTAARPEIEGGKLTGAGAGGCVVVLPKAGRETATLRCLARAGAPAFAVRASSAGAGLLGDLSPRPT
jgi:mevalonate kinase